MFFIFIFSSIHWFQRPPRESIILPSSDTSIVACPPGVFGSIERCTTQRPPSNVAPSISTFFHPHFWTASRLAAVITGGSETPDRLVHPLTKLPQITAELIPASVSSRFIFSLRCFI